MSMQEPTDDQLDGLFRKSAEEFNAPFDPAAWQALKSRLDTHDRLTIWEHLLRWGLPVLLLVVLTGGSWNAHRQRMAAGQTPNRAVAVRQLTPADDNPVQTRPVQPQPGRVDKNQLIPNERASGPSQPDQAAIPVAQPDDSKQPALTASADTPVQNRVEMVASLAIEKRNGPITTEETNGKTRPAGATTAVRSAYRVKPARSSATNRASAVRRPERARSGAEPQRQSRRLVEKTAKNRVAATFLTTNYAIKPKESFTKRRVKSETVTEQLVQKSLVDNELIPDETVAIPVVLSSFTELSSRAGQWPKSLSFISREVTMPIDSAETKQPVTVQPALSQKGLSVRFVVSPDLSAIGLRNFRRPGTNVGLLLEYRVASRWSVQAGVIRSTKVYKALTTDYELPAYVANLRVPPESVNGRCNMFDIPINLRYDVALRPRLNGLTPSRWFVSGGVTTYIMQQEDYVYNYPVGTRMYPSTPKGWNGNTGRYNFSQLNFSAGYERALSRRLSWQVEPFIKAPLKGVGHYKIKLLSTGAFFSLRYKL